MLIDDDLPDLYQVLQDFLPGEICPLVRDKDIIVQLHLQFGNQHVHALKSQPSLQPSYVQIITFDDGAAQSLRNPQRRLSPDKWIAIAIPARPETHFNYCVFVVQYM